MRPLSSNMSTDAPTDTSTGTVIDISTDTSMKSIA